MAGFVIFGGIAIAALFALAVPWVGVLAAYLIGILNPQSIWWWQFEGSRLVLMVAAPTLVGAAIAGMMGRLRIDALLSWRIYWLLVILACAALSSISAPYSLNNPALGLQSSAFILEYQFKITLMVLVAVTVSCAQNRLSAMSWMMVGVGLYMTWWINDRYLFGGAFGRIGGPTSLNGAGGGTYEDENSFATLFVATVPFLWYMGLSVRSAMFRYLLWAVIPFVWHAVFLTGSRGGFLAMAATLLLMAVRFKQRFVGVGVVVAFVVAFVWQGGETMWERVDTIDEYQSDGSAMGRLNAWQAATKMMMTHPLTGVGPGAFLRAFPNYSDELPRQAHNTVFQLGAEYGPLAALAFVGLIFSCIGALWRNGNRLAEHGRSKDVLHLLNEATLTAIVGVTVCSMFLTLQLFELLYFLVFMASAIVVTSRDSLQMVVDSARFSDSTRHPVSSISFNAPNSHD
jgi:probable O-glycosylation ligase (exosortase A-associated)